VFVRLRPLAQTVLRLYRVSPVWSTSSFADRPDRVSPPRLTGAPFAAIGAVSSTAAVLSLPLFLPPGLAYFLNLTLSDAWFASPSSTAFICRFPSLGPVTLLHFRRTCASLSTPGLPLFRIGLAGGTCPPDGLGRLDHVHDGVWLSTPSPRFGAVRTVAFGSEVIRGERPRARRRARCARSSPTITGNQFTRRHPRFWTVVLAPHQRQRSPAVFVVSDGSYPDDGGGQRGPLCPAAGRHGVEVVWMEINRRTTTTKTTVPRSSAARCTSRHRPADIPSKMRTVLVKALRAQ